MTADVGWNGCRGCWVPVSVFRPYVKRKGVHVDWYCDEHTRVCRVQARWGESRRRRRLGTGSEGKGKGDGVREGKRPPSLLLRAEGGTNEDCGGMARGNGGIRTIRGERWLHVLQIAAMVLGMRSSARIVGVAPR
jgi:hypothetical protein